jgi:ABC-2 type transport system permease protein
MNTARDTLLIFRRNMKHSLREPVWVVIGLINPILYLAFFGPLLTRIANPSFGAGSSWQVYVPGLLVQLGLFGSAFVGFGLIAEWRMGVIERMRVTPVSRLALLMGRVLRDVLVLLTQSLLLVVAATAFGLRVPIFGLLIALWLILLLAISLSCLSYTVALWTKSEDSFAPLLNSVTVPLMLLSGILLPISLGPGWLRVICHFNPFYYVVEAIRDAFVGKYATAAVFEGTLIAMALAVVSIGLGTRTFQKENV